MKKIKTIIGEYLARYYSYMIAELIIMLIAYDTMKPNGDGFVAFWGGSILSLIFCLLGCRATIHTANCQRKRYKNKFKWIYAELERKERDMMFEKLFSPKYNIPNE